ncbi:AEC family transporter [Bifidobacterium sp. 82T24]|uniref:AEC family transporter n=1 Tax=Bifidobacterium pluvialisilvae TaxID=2834436 RepID=UPI001C56A707|nr:AEC family transporter [Bifidobacterium pluvialisilvae]MBW3087514.1 AEC family transporter [Bifidobacterium pluvialisilvae]
MSGLIHPIALLAIVFVGYGFKRAHIFGEKDYRILQRIVFNLTLPAAIIVSFLTNPHDPKLLWISLFGLACGLFPTPILYFLSRHKPVNERAFLMLNGAGFNIGNFCFPVMQSMLGSASLVTGAMFDMGNCVVVAAGNNLLTQRLLHIDPDRPLSEQNHGDMTVTRLPRIKPKDRDARRLARHATIRGIAKSFLTSVPFDTYLLMIVLMFTGVKLPGFVVDVLSPVGDANGFCSMLMVGMLMDFPNDRREVAQALRVVACRIPFAVLFGLVTWFLLPYDAPTRKAIIMLCMAPTAVFATLFSDRVLGNAKMAGFCLSVTAVMGMVAMTAANYLIPA